MIPNNEIIKNLNEVNQKIDTLTNLVNKLINDLQINKDLQNV
jgi:tetrahydromethanopterin S-methyltransferase subunit B